MPDKTLDLIVWGATGFTGQIVCKYINQNYGTAKELNWAIAGRNLQKLEEVKRQLEAPELPILIADSTDKTALEAMARQTKVVCSTVGPYAIYGSLLVEVCAENGTHYCDLTGEVQWMRKMIDAHHLTAKKNKARIVHSCGFDSIPSDLGVFYVQEKAREYYGQYCEEIKMLLKGARGGFSGGTYASLSNVQKEASDNPDIIKILQNPYALNPQGEQQGPDGPDLTRVIYDEDLQAWLGPFVMGPINTRVVRRSQALEAYPYGRHFKYSEMAWFGPKLSDRIMANLTTTLINWVMYARPGSFFKKLIDYFSPKSGQGPSKATREAGFFSLLFVGTLPDGRQIKAKVTGDQDPGYGSTSKMLAESAICLAKDQDQLPETFGVLTPKTAMGKVLMNRMEQFAGLKFRFVSRGLNTL